MESILPFLLCNSGEFYFMVELGFFFLLIYVLIVFKFLHDIVPLYVYKVLQTFDTTDHLLHYHGLVF